ncbi:MAG TPA: hypothetical protein VN397_04375 [Candidatus Methylomirabilis sp.]|nr:hypothetical protein [Candidatus Methylomirabilis sp.]
MPIKRGPTYSPIRTYMRAIGISTVKNIVYNTVVIMGVLFVFGYVPQWLYQYGSYALFVSITYLFAEWTFSRPRVELRTAAILTLLTYLWDAFIMILIWSNLANKNLFFTQRFTIHLVFFTLHALVMFFAWYNVRRMKVRMSLAEGLES